MLPGQTKTLAGVAVWLVVAVIGEGLVPNLPRKRTFFDSLFLCLLGLCDGRKIEYLYRARNGQSIDNEPWSIQLEIRSIDQRNVGFAGLPM